MAAKSGQRFIRENRAPRVHIEYEVETYGSLQKVELPFVMGVMSDLSGQSKVEKKALDDARFVVPPDYQVVELAALLGGMGSVRLPPGFPPPKRQR